MDLTLYVRNELVKRNWYEAQIAVLENYLYDNDDSNAKDELNRYRLQLKMIDSWILCLQEDERFVVELHLIRGLDWARVTDEHKRRWGAGGRCKRSLRYRQESALSRIADEVNGNPERYKPQFL